MRHGLVDRLGLPFGVIGNGTGGSPAPFVSAYRAAVLADGANGYWRLGEAVGLVAVDETLLQDGAYSATGVTYGQGGLITGDPATSVLFDGLTGEVSIPNHVRYTLATTGALSIETWFLSAADGGTRRLVRKADAAELTAEWTFTRIATGAIRGQVWDAVGNPVITVTSPGTYLAASGKHHAVLTLQDGVDGILYIDGVAVANDNTWVGAPLGNQANPVTISATSGGVQYNGQEQEVAIYPSILSPAQVAAHFALG